MLAKKNDSTSRLQPGPILSVAEMRQADVNTIANGTPSIELMRRAAELIGQLVNVEIRIEL